jgi:hypothetical protein
VYSHVRRQFADLEEDLSADPTLEGRTSHNRNRNGRTIPGRHFRRPARFSLEGHGPIDVAVLLHRDFVDRVEGQTVTVQPSCKVKMQNCFKLVINWFKPVKILLSTIFTIQMLFL